MGTEIPQPKIPTATYRIQFNLNFTFAAGREIIGYLHELGISDLYASSYVAAKSGSLHGYDVVNPTVLNGEIGDEENFRHFTYELVKHDMGQILDFVPNHMCIESSENRWWMDLLENGRSSRHAAFFDIDWNPAKKELINKVLLPFLAEQYGKALEQGQLRLCLVQGAFWLAYNQTTVPLEPKSTVLILGHRLEELQQNLAADFPPLMELLSIITALQHLPSVDEDDPEKKDERYREKEIIKKRLNQLIEESSEVAEFIEQNITIINGNKDDRKSFELLDRLLSHQVYRLSYWRVATEEINYRRFFDINGLAAIRMEEPEVFRETHPLLLRLIRERVVTGVRVDHVDGLYDPFSYLHQLQKNAFMQLLLLKPDSPGQVCCAAGGAKEEESEDNEIYQTCYDGILLNDPLYKPLYLLCEKILMKAEALPDEWPVHGSTGYDFLASLNGIFVDTENARAFDRIYNRFTGIPGEYRNIVYEKKKLVMLVALSGEINMLGNRLNSLAEQNRLTRDFTLNSLVQAIREVIACFPVYRTYVNSRSVRGKDRQYVDVAVAWARRINPALDGSIFDFLRSVLLLEFQEDTTENVKSEMLDFVMKFQQTTGPVMAKGVEDTAFYTYNRLISLNEVGGTPGRFGTPVEMFHGQNMDRLRNFPHALSATATHDTKRGEDARTRINVLSEMPGKWRKALFQWSRINRKKRKMIEGRRVPDRNEEYMFYQALLGVWPVMEPPEQENLANTRSRVREYMIKALREAKVNSSWINPDPVYEEGVISFIDTVLADSASNPFLADFIPFCRLISHCGLFSSLSQTLLKIVSPGIPDFYQGCELWDFSLVDPDNRRPVDYSKRMQNLEWLKAREAETGAKELFGELLENCADGRIKQYLIYRMLGYRNENQELFQNGEYIPLEGQGALSGHICAFARRLGEKCVVAVAPRFFATVAPEPGKLPLGERAWLSTVLILPEGESTQYRNVLTDEKLEASEHEGLFRIPLARIFESAPVALLESQ